MKKIAALAMGVCLAACASTGGSTAQNANAYADFLIGRLANLRDDHRVASDRYYEALRTTPRDRYLVEGGARASLAIGDVDRARDIARSAGSLDIPAVRLVRAVDALSASRWASVRALIDPMQGDVDEEFAGRFIAAWSKAGDGRVDDAVADFSRISAPRPFSGVFAFQAAMALDYAGRKEAALAGYAAAEAEGLWLPPAVMRHADLLVRAGRRDDALALLTRFSTETRNPEIDRARTLLEANQPLGLAPLTPARGAAIGLYGFGGLLTQESNAEDGLVMLSLSLMLDPGLDSALLAFAEAQRDSGHGEEARAALAQLPRDSAYAETAALMSAWILRQDGKDDDAIAAAQAASAHGGGRRAQVALADLYRSMERYADAEPIYSALIGEASDEWRLYFARGATRERLGRWSEAEADLRRALELSPDQPDVLNYLGYTWVDRGERLHEGLAMIERAAELRPQSGAILDSLGWAHYRLGAYDEAIGYLERAVELEPADPTLNDHLGDGYWRLGRRLEARFQWRRVLTLDPSDEARADVERKLATGLPVQPLADARR